MTIDVRCALISLSRTESAEILGAVGLPGISSFSPSTPSKTSVYELRTYQLNLGYDTMPKMVSAFQHGLPSKIAADVERKGELVTVAFSEVGRVNQFVEVWRYKAIEDSAAVREASRKAEKWRETVAQAASISQSFTNTFYRPTSFSPMQ